MDYLVREFMQNEVRTIGPEVKLPELEKAFVRENVSGFPVIDDGQLVGIVSRSDIVRQLYLEHYAAEMTSDFYFDQGGFHESPSVSFKEIADRVGERIEQLTVKEVMSRALVKVSPETTLRAAAQTLLDNHVHRLLVTDNRQLLGIVSATDMVRLIANGRVKADIRPV
jgi:CBS domain-containing protein